MTETHVRHLTFFVGEEEYAVPLSRIETALDLEELTRLPMAPRYVRGLLSVQGAALPVLDLAERFGAGATTFSEHPSVLAVRVRLEGRNVLVGLLAVRLGRVLSVAVDRLEQAGPVIPLVPEEYLTGFVEVAGRFVVCLDVDRLLDADQYAELAELSELRERTERREARRWRPHLIVRLASERCALPLTGLREALACGDVTRVPGSAAHVLGATNVRGSIVTVLDLARRYAITPDPQRSERLLVLAELDGEAGEVPTGFVVDGIEGLARIDPDSVERTPPFGTAFPPSLVLGMAPHAGRWLPILDCQQALKPPDTPVEGRPGGDSPPRKEAADVHV